MAKTHSPDDGQRQGGRGAGRAAQLLIHTLRERLGAHRAAHRLRTSHCGACTVDLDGMSVKSCTVLTVQCDGGEVLTIEGSSGRRAAPAAAGLPRGHGLQCGYCTPGMITRAYRLLQENPDPSEEEIRYGIAGNLCRCTGYQNIVKAVQSRPRSSRRAARRPRNERAMTSELQRARAAKLQGMGCSMQRVEDARFTQGKGNYVDDIKLPGMLFGDFVRSPYGARAHQVDRQAQGARRCPASSRC